ncbi:hypothetical protein [Candidatus Halobonum tyrrellensis]|uniref:Uncharacterized protein n=1 Tax=Candidatus Halobonum tyrrellensis G22 TaxID=1324957 RepID=V4GPE3_9EURY|nr:hypothetical protein [Candidatus Halobonum tyrrellensis]ESP87251.1 hypothetical protein K933_15339 [Candidatus Halobonum tyrrellensis G22]
MAPTDHGADADPDGDAGAMVAAVQEAAVEHARTAGDARRALALVGALEPLRGDAAGTDLDSVATTLLSALTAWIRLREGAGFAPAGPPAPPTPPGPDAGADSDGDPAVEGAAVACERFGLSVPRAASLASCSPEAVARRVGADESRPVR